MATSNEDVTRRAIGWAIGMTVALYAMIWLVAGPPKVLGATAGTHAATQVAAAPVSGQSN